MVKEFFLVWVKKVILILVLKYKLPLFLVLDRVVNDTWRGSEFESERWYPVQQFWHMPVQLDLAD